jgi:hypothetical protein
MFYDIGSGENKVQKSLLLAPSWLWRVRNKAGSKVRYSHLLSF